MFKSLFGKRRPEEFQAPQEPLVEVDLQGLHYRSPAKSTAEWLARPFEYAESQDLAARLAQISMEGIGGCREHTFFLSWTEVYTLLGHPEFASYREALLIPPVGDVRPRLISQGSLADSNFRVLIDEWVDAQGRPVRPAPKLTGRVLVAGELRVLVTEPIHFLLEELDQFHATTDTERTLAFKEQFFGRMRKLAKLGAWPVSDYVERTIVLTPDRLRLVLDRRGEGDARTLEVVPDFDEAPSQWLGLFDRLQLRDSYDVPDGASLVRVVLTPAVKTVLAEIKRMPGRRVFGPRAEAFVRNPFGVLGDDAHAVIDSEQFDQALEDAGIRFERFTPHVERGEFGEVLRVALLVENLSRATLESATIFFDGPDELQRFVGRLGRAVDDGSQCVTWQGHDLEIDGDSTTQLAHLEDWLREWSSPALWTAAEVLDLSHYSDRVEDIGIEQPFLTPVIARNDSGSGWFEGNVTVGIRVEDGAEFPRTIVPIALGEVPSLQRAVQAAERASLPAVHLPGLKVPVPIADARRAVDALAKVVDEVRRRGFNPPDKARAAEPKKRLIIKRNLEEIDYSEARADALQMPEGRQAVLPISLRPDVALKPYQLVGVAWLQHLWASSPDRCRELPLVFRLPGVDG